MEFEVINTEEEFQAAVTARYGDFQGTINTLTTERDNNAATVAQLQGELNTYRQRELRGRIAAERGVPLEMADRITGSTEQEMQADAERLLGIIRTIRGPAPLADNTDPVPKNAVEAGLKNMLNQLKGAM